MGLRGPQSVRIPALKAHAVQWAYLLFGLRDGHPDLLQRLAWTPWRRGYLRAGVYHREGKEEFSIGRAYMILFARIFLKDGVETADRVFEGLTYYATRKPDSIEARLEHPLVQHIGKDITIPKESAFGLGRTDVFNLAFPPISRREYLWNHLKHAKSRKQMQRVADRIVRSMPSIPGLSASRRSLRDHGAELYGAKCLWTYPQATDRPKSDDKRVEFFAKALAGLMLGVSPATAMKRLSRWKLPKLWIKEEIEQ